MAAGLADHLGIDVAVVRIVFVVAALFSGIGIIAYLLLWLFVPAADGTTGTDELTRAVERTPRREAGFWVGIVLLVIGAVMLASLVGGFFMAMPGRFGLPLPHVDLGSLLVPLVLIGIGVALWRSSTNGDAGGTRPDPSTARLAPVGAAADQPPTAERPRRADPLWVPPPEHPQPRSGLGRLIFALALVVSGGLWLGGLLGLARVGPVTVLAAALLVVGVGLLVGAWWGRARWLIVVGLLLSPIVAVAAIVDPLGIPIRGAVGSQAVTVPPGAPVASSYELAAGEMVLDLRLAAIDAGTSTTVRMGVGELVVYVPDGVDVVVDVRLAAGEIDLFGQVVAGPRVELFHDDRARPGGGQEPGAEAAGTQPVLHLDIRGGIGEVEVQRGDEAAHVPRELVAAPAVRSLDLLEVV